MIVSQTNNGSGSPGAPTAGKQTKRDRFHQAVRCQRVDRPPLWMMRQAGRALPEYRALKEKHSFLEMVRTPDLAIEVTLQPIRRFGFDAAILFSDILVIPEALGQGYSFRETGGVQMDFPVASRKDIDALKLQGLNERLGYVETALKGLKRELNGHTALLGFAGAPWTLANFMLQGGGSAGGTFDKAINLYQDDRASFEALMEKLTNAVAGFLEMQITAGAETVQLFDSVGGLLAKKDYPEISGKWNEQIIRRVSQKAPVILFAKGNADWEYQAGTGANVLGIDQSADLKEVSKRVPGTIALQGNLDPDLLVGGSTKQVADETTRILETMRDRPGHIFNLGHGLLPAAKLENVAAVVQTVQNFV